MKFPTTPALILLSAISLSAASKSVVISEEIEPRLAEGRNLVKAGKLDAALEIYARIKQDNPEDMRPFLLSAEAMLQAGRSKDAALELDEAASKTPGAADEILVYARARDQLGHLREAARVLADAERADALPPEGLWLLADLHYRLKEAKEALRVLNRFAERRPNDPRLKLRRGQVLIYLEEFEPALTAIEEWVWAHPSEAEGHFEMARTLRYGNNLEAAREAALKAVRLAPSKPEYLHMAGIICDGLKLYEEAVEYLRRAATAPGAFTRIYFDLGNALRRAGNSEEALEALRKYRELYTAEEARANDDKKVEALLNQGRLQAQKGQPLEALASFQRVLEVDPQNWPAHSFLAKLYLSSPNPELARPHLEWLQTADPESSEGAFLAAFYRYERRELEAALELAERSKRLRPGDAELRNLLGNIHFAAGRFSVAASEYAAASALAPDRFDFRANLKTAQKKLEGSSR